IALVGGSQAINTGANPTSLPFDQRGSGFPRSVGGTTDIGAVEVGPVQVTVVKRLQPASDPGRFDLQVDGSTVRAGAGDGDRGSLLVAPGSTGTVREVAAAGTNLADYDTSIDCGAGPTNG